MDSRAPAQALEVPEGLWAEAVRKGLVTAPLGKGVPLPASRVLWPCLHPSDTLPWVIR